MADTETQSLTDEHWQTPIGRRETGMETAPLTEHYFSNGLVIENIVQIIPFEFDLR